MSHDSVNAQRNWQWLIIVGVSHGNKFKCFNIHTSDSLKKQMNKKKLKSPVCHRDLKFCSISTDLWQNFASLQPLVHSEVCHSVFSKKIHNQLTSQSLDIFFTCWMSHFKLCLDMSKDEFLVYLLLLPLLNHFPHTQYHHNVLFLFRTLSETIKLLWIFKVLIAAIKPKKKEQRTGSVKKKKIKRIFLLKKGIMSLQ